jgi:hypothetical protein
MFGLLNRNTKPQKPSFGKSASAAGPAQKHLIPEALFDKNTKTGSFLDLLGKKADDSSNLASSENDIQSKMDMSVQKLNVFMASVTDRLPKGCAVRPFYMIPAQLWQGRHGQFLGGSLDMMPYDTWNVLVLPVDTLSSSILRLQQHPGAAHDDEVAGAERLVGEIRDRVISAKAAIESVIQRGETPDFSQMTTAINQARANVAGLAGFLGAHCVGEETHARSREMFFAEPKLP